jgi:hypothetical protein
MVPLGDRIIEAFAWRDGRASEVMRFIEQMEDAEETEDGVYRSARQIEAAKAVEDSSRDLWMELANEAAGVVKSYNSDPPQATTPAFKVTDRRGAR